MSYHLIVRNPFGGYTTGARITDPAIVTAILADERQKHVVRVVPPKNDLPGAATPAATLKLLPPAATPAAATAVVTASARSAAPAAEPKGQN